MKFAFFNDTNRNILIHPGTLSNGVQFDDNPTIKPLEIKTFILPDGTYPLVKLWDHDRNLTIYVGANQAEFENSIVPLEKTDMDKLLEKLKNELLKAHIKIRKLEEERKIMKETIEILESQRNDFFLELTRVTEHQNKAK